MPKPAAPWKLLRFSYTMQVLHRLGFSWNQTSREYIDMIFDMLRSLGYFRAN